MSSIPETRRDPETGEVLTRGVRRQVIQVEGRDVTVDMPGWYRHDDETGEGGLHSQEDSAYLQSILREETPEKTEPPKGLS